MGLREKYDYAIQTAKSFHMEGSADERDGKLHFHGTVATQEEANKIWDAIKTIPTWQSEIAGDIKATGKAAAAGSTYTVKSGDTLSKIAMRLYGSFEEDDVREDVSKIRAANPQIKNANLIYPGQSIRVQQASK